MVTFSLLIFSFLNLYSPENVCPYSSNSIENDWKFNPIYVSPVVKIHMQLHPAAHLHNPLTIESPPSGRGALRSSFYAFLRTVVD